MKLDKITFAKLITYVSTRGASLSHSTVLDIDDMIDIEMPPAPIDVTVLHQLLEAIQAGRKIDAIKVHRNLTGYALKESKDVIEKYWVPSTDKKQQMLTKIEQQMCADFDSRDSFTLYKFDNSQLQTIKNFIESF